MIHVFLSACSSKRDKWEMHIQKGEYIHHAGWKNASPEENGMHRGISNEITDARGNCSQ